MTVELFGNVASRSNRVHWALEELEIPYKFYQINFERGEHRSEPFLALNPAGKVPVLRDGDLVLTESAAICNYLGEKHPEKGLVPAGGTKLRAKYDQWLFFVLAELEQPLWTTGKHKFAIPKKYRVPTVIPTAQWEFQQAAILLSRGLEGQRYILGEQMTMVDIFIAHTLVWAQKFQFSIEVPHLEDYLSHMKKRPALARILTKPRLELPGLASA